jgi:hypothetical protein
VRQWPEIVVEGETEENVFARARADLESLLRSGRIVQLELEVNPEAHPWLEFAVMFADDSDWPAFQEAIQQYRVEMEKALAET